MSKSSIAEYLKHFNQGLLNIPIDHQLALSWFQKSLSAYPIGFASFINIGHLHFLDQSYLNAIQTYKIAIQLKPYLSIGYCSRFLVYIRTKDYKNALSDINAAISCQYLRRFVEDGEEEDLNLSVECAANNLQALIYRKLINQYKNPKQAKIDKQLIKSLSERYQISDLHKSQQINYYPTEIPFFELCGEVHNFQSPNILRILKQKLKVYQKLLKNETQKEQKQQKASLSRWKSSGSIHKELNISLTPKERNKSKCFFNSSMNTQNKNHKENKKECQENSHKTVTTNKKLSIPKPLKNYKQDQQHFQERKTNIANNWTDQFQSPDLSFIGPTQVNEFNFRKSLKNCPTCLIKKKNHQTHPSIKNMTSSPLIVSINIVKISAENKRKAVRFCRFIYDEKNYNTQQNSNQGRQIYWHEAFEIEYQNKQNIGITRVELWEKQGQKQELIGEGKMEVKLGKVKIDLRLNSKYIGYGEITFKKHCCL